MVSSIDVCIQHHPRRAGLIEPLLASIPGARVISDPDPDGYPSPWRTYRTALEQPIETTHRLVIQDDAVVCRNFPAALALAVAARPENPIVLFVAGQPRMAIDAMASACHRDETFADWPPDTWVAAVAVVWPVATIDPILRYVEKQNYPVKFRADDEILGRATRALGIKVVATVPSLVQHPDVVESVVAHRRAAGGLNTDRVAWCFADDAGCDPLDLEWR